MDLMDKMIIRRAILLIFSLALLTGCQNDSQEETSTISPEDIRVSALAESEGPIVIEGNLVPKSVVNLSFAIPGSIQKVFVTEGESVADGQLLAAIGDRQQAEAVVAASELELLMAQQDLQALRDNHAAQLTEVYLALVSSRQDVKDAEQLLDQLTGEVLEIDIAAAEAQLILASDSLEAAEDDFAEVEDEDEDNPARANLQLRLAEARRAYDAAVRLLDDLQGDGYAFRLQQAEDMLQVAQDQLALAEERYDEVSMGPDPDALALAEARVATAVANLTAAQGGLEQYELRAPMAGRVVGLALKVGELVTAGQPVGQVVDLSAWLVETLDLTEFDVVSIDPTGSVLVTADALPEVTMTGTVLSIDDVPRAVRGDVTYVARVRLDTTDPRLRWGMTVLVEFQ
jgi:multidrug efflux pump subunit AcrA (membrane-fusion protein)